MPAVNCFVCMADKEVRPVVSQYLPKPMVKTRPFYNHTFYSVFICRPCWEACLVSYLEPQKLKGRTYRRFTEGVILKDIRDEILEEIIRRLTLFPQYKDIIESRNMALVLKRLEGSG